MEEPDTTTDESRLDLTGDHQDSRRRVAGLEQSAHRVRRARTRTGDGHAEAAGCPRTAVGRVNCGLLVTNRMPRDAPIAQDRIGDRKVVHADDAEHLLHAERDKRLDHRLAACLSGHRDSFLEVFG